MNNKIINIFIFIVSMFFISCIGVPGGTHGYIKRYRYSINKDLLANAVNSVIRTEQTIDVDSVHNEYNDGDNYISINIATLKGVYSYVIHYYGSKEYWDTSKTSAISLVYAYNEKREGGSAGNGGIKWYNFNLKKQLIQPLEQEFISKVDKELDMKHTEE
ncbi:MAG: hypothetical protein H7257_11745 [Taibaiella sp.]|nr:hypothetical protein [Taibaiella sp.]